MVVGAFPAAKLGALLLRQISKPIAEIVKRQAKSHPIFRKYVCMPPAQFYHWCEVKSKMWILNMGRTVNIPVLNEAMAIELGANLLGEAVIFLIAAGILVNEYTRSAAKEAAKENARKQEMTDLQNAIRELYIEIDEKSANIREISRKLGEQDTEIKFLEKSLGVKIPKDKKSPPALESPPYSPVSEDPNLLDSSVKSSVNETPSESNRNISQMRKAPTEIYQITSQNRYEESQENYGLILRSVNEVKNEFWNYPLGENKLNALSLALIHLHKTIFKTQV